MHLLNEGAELYIPDNSNIETALEKTTHLGIGAHPDDLEIIALPGIFSHFDNPDDWFFGVTVTNGVGSSRSEEHA